MSDLVLQIPYGGLGDHLFYSHIPRIAKETGKYDKVFLSSRSEFRHPDYLRIIWEYNPYFDGIIDKEGISVEFNNVQDGENILDRIMLLLNLDDHKRYHEPEIYFNPLITDSLSNKNIYDPNFVSYVGTLDSKSLNFYINKNNIQIDIMMKLRPKNIGIIVNEIIDTPTLDEFCSVIVSCNNLYCLTSGTATLAAALRKPATVFWGVGQNKMFHHSKLHDYIMIDELLSVTFNRNINNLIKIVKNKSNDFFKH